MTKTLKLTRITLNRDVPPHPHPPPPKKVHQIFIITIFDSHTMYCDFCAWTICGSKKGDIQLEGTLTKYQSFRTVLKKIYHLLLTIFNWDQFRR